MVLDLLIPFCVWCDYWPLIVDLDLRQWRLCRGRTSRGGGVEMVGLATSLRWRKIGSW